MPSKLFHHRIAAIVTDGFEQSELLLPKKALEDAGATVDVISIKSMRKSSSIKAWSRRASLTTFPPSTRR